MIYVIKQQKIKIKGKYLESSSHIGLDKCIRMKHTSENPDFFHIDSIFNDYIANRKRRFVFYLVKYDFIISF